MINKKHDFQIMFKQQEKSLKVSSQLHPTMMHRIASLLILAAFAPGQAAAVR